MVLPAAPPAASWSSAGASSAHGSNVASVGAHTETHTYIYIYITHAILYIYICIYAHTHAHTHENTQIHQHSTLPNYAINKHPRGTPDPVQQATPYVSGHAAESRRAIWSVWSAASRTGARRTEPGVSRAVGCAAAGAVRAGGQGVRRHR